MHHGEYPFLLYIEELLPCRLFPPNIYHTATSLELLTRSKFNEKLMIESVAQAATLVIEFLSSIYLKVQVSLIIQSNFSPTVVGKILLEWHILRRLFKGIVFLTGIPCENPLFCF